MSYPFRFASAVFSTSIWCFFASLRSAKVLVTLFFCSLSVRYLICSIALVPKVVIFSVLYFLVLHFVPFVPAIPSVFVCKPRVSTCYHLRARKEVLVQLVHVRSADILTLLEGSFQIARNVAMILEEQTSRLPRNQSGTVQAPFCSWVRLTFLVRRARRTIVVSS